MQTNPRRKPNKHKSYLPIIILTVMAIALFSLIFWPKDRPKPIATPESNFSVFLTEAALQSVEVQLDNGVKYRLENKDGTLYLEQGTQLHPVDASIAERIRDVLSRVYAQSRITQKTTPTLGMRLNPAHISIRAVFADGKQVSYAVGAQIPLIFDYYFAISEAEGIFAINEGFEDLFFRQPDTLIAVADAQLHRNLIKSIEFRGKFEAKVDIDSIESERIYGSLQADRLYPADAETLYRIVSALDQLRLGVFVEAYDGKKDFGFDKENALELVIEQHAGQNDTTSVPAGIKTLRFGNDADDFTVYTLFEGNVYRLSKITMQAILDVGVETLASKYPFALSLLDVSNLLSIEDSSPSGKTLWRIEMTAEDEGSEVHIYKDGRSYDLDAFKAMLNKALQERYDSFAVSPDLGDAPALRSFRIEMRSGTYQVDFYTADSFSDYIRVNNVIYSKWSKQKTASLFSLEGMR